MIRSRLVALAVAMLFLVACFIHPALCTYPHAQPDAVIYSPDDDGGGLITRLRD